MRKLTHQPWAFRAVAVSAAALMAGSALAADSLLTLNPSIAPQDAATRPADGAKPAAEKPAEAPKATAEPKAAEEISNAFVSDRATFLLTPSRIHGDPTIFWPGMLNGLRGFEHFYEPIGNPLYFESPFNNTGLRLLYLYHGFPDGSQIGGGYANVYAAQVRVALTERLAFIATKDGYTDMNAGILPPDDGWNDFAIGLKYVIIADKAADFVLTGGLRWEWENGDRGVLMGKTQELSPFISVAKGFDRLHLLGNVTGRLPMDWNDGNAIVSWDLHVDYEIAPKVLPGFAPVFEVHGLHYVSDGNALPLSVGGLDYSNIGSTDVAGDSVFWAGVGARWKLSPHMSLGSTYEFPLHNPDNDIMGNRVTVDLHVTW